jgi:hypothetical protein
MNQHHFAKDFDVLAFLSEKHMQMQTAVPKIQTDRKFSQQMRAVLLVLNADPYLMEAATPFINFETESIYWDKIQKLPLCSGHKSAVRWAYGIWTDEMPKGNCFDGALNMSPFLKVAVLEALCLRWGLRG